MLPTSTAYRCILSIVSAIIAPCGSAPRRNSFFTARRDKWNWIDLLGVFSTAAALALMVAQDFEDLVETAGTEVGTDAIVVGDTTNMLQQVLSFAILMSGFKVLYYLRGLQSAAFLVNMLEQVSRLVNMLILVNILTS
eukprot:COSAG01_NODE_572_length_15298_cov_8.549172_18_plen_138_part_00